MPKREKVLRDLIVSARALLRAVPLDTRGSVTLDPEQWEAVRRQLAAAREDLRRAEAVCVSVLHDTDGPRLPRTKDGMRELARQLRVPGAEVREYTDLKELVAMEIRRRAILGHEIPEVTW